MQEHSVWQKGVSKKLRDVAKAIEERDSLLRRVQTQKTLLKEIQAKLSAAKALSEFTKNNEGECIDEVTSDLETIEGMKEDAQETLNEMQKKLELDTGKYYEFENYFGKCAEENIGKYTYRVCLFEEAVQEEGSKEYKLGKWNGFSSDYSKIFYSDGERCFGGPERSLTLDLRCGEELKLHSLTELEKCVYNAKLEIPSACQVDF
mgnify:CR=1 FL=1